MCGVIPKNNNLHCWEYLVGKLTVMTKLIPNTMLRKSKENKCNFHSQHVTVLHRTFNEWLTHTHTHCGLLAERTQKSPLVVAPVPPAVMWPSSWLGHGSCSHFNQSKKAILTVSCVWQLHLKEIFPHCCIMNGIEWWLTLTKVDTV